MKLFVWDFHGVLEKGTEFAALEISNIILERFNYQERFTEEDGHNLFGLKWYKYFEYLLPYETYERHLELQEACFEKSSSSPEIIAKYILPNDYCEEVISKIHSTHQQIIISNTKPYSLDMFISAVKLDKFFTKKNAFAVDMHNSSPTRTKQHILKLYLRNKTFDDIIIIGDSSDDVGLVKVAGGTTYLYMYPGKQHKQAEANYKIHDLREVLREV